jgi:hypothetical protein
MKYARIDQHTAIEVASQDPAILFHPSVAAMFISVPNEVVVGSTVDDDGVWSPPVPGPEIPEPEPLISMRELTPAEFILLFSASELIAIKTSTNPAVNLYWEMIYEKDRIKSINVQNPLLDQILGLFASEGLITPERQAEIKAAGIALAKQV